MRRVGSLELLGVGLFFQTVRVGVRVRVGRVRARVRVRGRVRARLSS